MILESAACMKSPGRPESLLPFHFPGACVDKARDRMMQAMLKLHELKYYDSAVIRDDLEKYGLIRRTNGMAHLNDRILPFLKAYLEQYATMVDMLEGIDNKVAAEVYAMSVAFRGAWSGNRWISPGWSRSTENGLGFETALPRRGWRR